MKSPIARACKTRQSCGGWILIEMMTSLVILGILMFALIKTQQQIQMFNAVQLARMRCIAAAQAQLDSIAVTDGPIAADELARLWPGIRMEVEQSAGEGQWTGLRLLKVTAVGKAKGPEVEVELTRYVGPK